MLKKQKSLFIIVVLAMILLVSCREKEKTEKKSQESIVTASLAKPVFSLYFNAIVEPIKNIPVLSPVDGNISSILFDYGRIVKKGSPIVTITSKSLSEDFAKRAHDYLLKKNTYLNSIESFQGNKMLFDAGVINKDSYVDLKSQYENNVLDYYQSIYDLQEVMQKAQLPEDEVLHLTLGDVQKVDKVIHHKLNDIKVLASGTGIALFPITDQSSGNNTDQHQGKLNVGDAVKEGQSILNIGDMSGLLFDFTVSEININKMKVGMPATVTSTAFPGLVLKGEVTAVSLQAESDQNVSGAVSMFKVTVKVPKILDEQKKIIHVGMSAKVQIDINDAPAVMLPIDAVSESDGASLVTILDANGNKKQVKVTTGKTTQDKVVITSGVHVGDKVVVYGAH